MSSDYIHPAQPFNYKNRRKNNLNSSLNSSYIFFSLSSFSFSVFIIYDKSFSLLFLFCILEHFQRMVLQDERKIWELENTWKKYFLTDYWKRPYINYKCYWEYVKVFFNCIKIYISWKYLNRTEYPDFILYIIIFKNPLLLQSQRPIFVHLLIYWIWIITLDNSEQTFLNSSTYCVLISKSPHSELIFTITFQTCPYLI